MITAEILYEVLRKHDVSKNRLADMLGVNEKQVRKMLDGSTSVPAGVLYVMPMDMADDYYAAVKRRRGSTPRPLLTISSALDELEAAPDLELTDIAKLTAIGIRVSALIGKASQPR